MSCEGCKYIKVLGSNSSTKEETKEANEYCEDCNEYTHDKHTEGAASWFEGFYVEGERVPKTGTPE